MSWAKRIQAAVKRGRFTPSDMKLAGSWSTCAVGERPRKITGVYMYSKGNGGGFGLSPSSPFDAPGMDFMRAVENNRVGAAVDHYITIRRIYREQRAAGVSRS